jgi:hypothetical protein
LGGGAEKYFYRSVSLLLVTLFVIAWKIFILKSVGCFGENLTMPLALKCSSISIYDVEAIRNRQFVIMQFTVLFLCIIFSTVDSDHAHFAKYVSFQAPLP